jgi:hypothetical protein
MYKVLHNTYMHIKIEQQTNPLLWPKFIHGTRYPTQVAKKSEIQAQ